MILHLPAYTNLCIYSPFSTISRRFFISGRVGDDILEVSGLLIALATFDALCWIMDVMISTIITLSSSYYNA